MQIPDEGILDYWSEDYVSEFGQENFEEFKQWAKKKGISRKSLVDFFITSGYSLENAARKYLLHTFSMLAILVDCFLYELYLPLFTKVLIQLLIQCQKGYFFSF